MTISKGIDYKGFKKRLEDARDEIEYLARITEKDRKPVELDQSQQGRLSRIDAIQVQEMAIEQERRREVESRRITAALKRIEDGDFGICNGCGEEIQLKRLEFDPSNPLCLDCAQG